MIVSINQPAYLPWLGYLQRIAASDVHIVLDHVQFEKSSFVNRNKIRGKDGPIWLTVPVLTKGKFGDIPINRLEFAPHQSWQKKHWASLRMVYARTPFFDRYAPAYEALYAEEWPSFAPMVWAFLRQHLADLGITTPLVRSSELDVPGNKNELIVNLIRGVCGSVYLSGALGRQYLDKAMFDEANIRFFYQEYRHREYSQAYPGFEPGMCVLDLLFNHGPASRGILTAGLPPPEVSDSSVVRRSPVYNGPQLRLRRAIEADCEKYYRWANGPIVRRNARTPGRIDPETHRNWFVERVNSPDALLLVCFDAEGQMLGQVRFDRKVDGIWEIDFSVDAAMRGLGIGREMMTLALKEFRRLEPGRAIAFVKHTNEPSRRVFEHLGFHAVGCSDQEEICYMSL